MGNSLIMLNHHIISNLFSKKVQIVMIGLDGAGKTTILYRLKLKKEISTTLPTTAFNVETVRPIKNLKFMVWDTAGNDNLRPLWRTYVRKSDAMIFVVDSSDQDRFDEARTELDHILSYSESDNIPLLILANKQDLSNAINPVELSQKLDLDSLNSKVIWNLHPTSGRFGDGLHDAMTQLAGMVEKNRKRQRCANPAENNNDGKFQKSEVSKFV